MNSRIIASIALGAAVALGTTGCAMISPQATEIPYSPGDGFNVPGDGPLDVRNALIVANEEGDLGNFVVAIVNPTSESHTLTIEFGEAPSTVTETIRVPANTTLSFGSDEEDPIPLEGIEMIPGTDIPAYFASGDAPGILWSVPVLDGAQEYLAPLVP